MLKSIVLGGAFSLLATAAFAHITLEQGQAPAGSTYKAVLRVPHGCDGAATTKVTVRVPEGMFAVKPKPLAGWELTTVTGTYAKPYDNHGTAVTEGVTEISWSGGKLPDNWYEEFIFRGSLAGDLPAGPIYFPLVQECEDGGVDRWIEIPAAGQDGDSVSMPAPSLTIVPKS